MALLLISPFYSTISDRLNFFLYPLAAILVSDIYEKINLNKKILMIIFINIFSILYLISWWKFSDNYYFYVPYKNYIFT